VNIKTHLTNAISYKKRAKYKVKAPQAHLVRTVKTKLLLSNLWEAENIAITLLPIMLITDYFIIREINLSIPQPEIDLTL